MRKASSSRNDGPTEPRRRSRSSQTRARTRAPARRPVRSGEAAQLVARYRLVIQAHPRRGFVGSSVEMPLVIAHGVTEAACLRATREAHEIAVAELISSGQHPPAPADGRKREVQINIRLTADERVRIQEQARQAGFRSLADYVRRAALRGGD